MPNRRIVNALSAYFETKRARRPWREELHPRDSKGRFVETGGIARIWGGGFARVLRALSQTKVQVSDLDGRNQRPIQTSRLTMVARPDGSAPTKSKAKVQAEEDRRDADPRRGDGHTNDDHGDPDTSDDPHATDDEGKPIGEDSAHEPRDAEPAKAPRFATVAAARNHLDSGTKDARWKRPPRTHNGVHLRGASKQERAQVRIDTYSSTRGMDFARTSQLSSNGNFLVTRHGKGKWDVYHVGSGTIMTHQAGFSSKPDALHFANELENARDDRGRPFDWEAPHVADRLGMAEGRDGINTAIARGRSHDEDSAGNDHQDAPQPTPAPAPAAAQPELGSDAPPQPQPQQDAPQGRFTSVAQVLQHWRTSPDSPRLRETHNEREKRQEGSRQRADTLQDAQLVDGLLVGRSTAGGSWFVFHPGTSYPIARLAPDAGKPDAIARARAYAAYKDEHGKPFNWDSDGLIDRLSSPEGKRMHAATAGRSHQAPGRHENNVPEGASEVAGFPGYRMARGEDGTNVYAPDGRRIATGESKFDRNTRRSVYVGDMDDRHVSGTTERDFALNAARQHTLAGLTDDQKDPMWVQFTPSRAVVHGTTKGDEAMRTRMRRAGFVWSDGAQAYVTTSTTRPVTRALAVDNLVRGLAHDEGRQIEVRRDEDRLRTPSTNAPDAAAAPGTPAATHVDEPAPDAPGAPDLGSLSDKELEDFYAQAEKDKKEALYDSDRKRGRERDVEIQARKTSAMEELKRRDAAKYAAANAARAAVGDFNRDRNRTPVTIDGEDTNDAGLQGHDGAWSWNRLGYGTRYSSERTFRTRDAAVADLIAEHDREQRANGDNSQATPAGPAAGVAPATTGADNHSTPDPITGDDSSGDEQAGADRSGALADVPARGVRGAGDGRGEGDLLRDARDAGESGDHKPDGADPVPAADQHRVSGRGEGQVAGTGAGAGARDGRADLPAGRARDGERRAARSRQGVVAPTFRPTSQRDLAPSGEKAKSRANVAAVQLLRQIQAENRPATADEQKVLARWSGWGSLPIVLADRPQPTDGNYRDKDGNPDPAKYARALKKWESFAKERAAVRELLDDNEWAAAKANTLNAHYTDNALVQPVWDLLRELGFDGGNVLEPGSGSGNFIGAAPDNTRITGVELDPTSAAISQLLYPHARIVNQSFGDLRLPDGHFDAVVGNVPFGRFPLYDEQVNPDLKHSIHDTFILKSLAKVRPGGLVAVITSRFTLDGEDDTARRQMASMGDLVGAVRLPAGAHQEAAGTGVVTDLLVFRRRLADENQHATDLSWLRSSKKNINGHEIAVNDYFQRHPRNVLGELTTGRGQFSDHDLTVVGDKEVTLPALRAAMERITSGSSSGGRSDRMRYVPEINAVDRDLELAGQKHEGAVHVLSDGSFTQVDEGVVVPLDVHPTQQEHLRKLLGLRDLTNQLLRLEGETRAAGENDRMRALRSELNKAYDAYAAAHGPLDKPGQTRFFTPQEAKDRAKAEGLKSVPDAWKLPTALQLFEDDPSSAVAFGLDKWDDGAKSGRKADIFSQRVLAPREIADRADSPEQAIALALELDGGELHLPTIARLLGSDDLADVREQIGPLAFDEPGTNRLVSRGEYLSGNVRVKLAQAQEAAASNPQFAANVAALKNVIPRDLDPAEIKVKMGAPWIPETDITAFLQHILGTKHVRAEHGGGSMWEVDGPTTGIAATSDWGTAAKPAPDVAKALLEQRTITVTKTIRVNGRETSVTDDEATSAAQAKAKEMADRFSEWVWEDPERSKRLARVYNDRFNNLVMREFDDSPLALPGAVADWNMRPHQNAAIRRIVTDPSVLLAHVVGAGKTATMVAGTQELRRTGLARKPAIIVPNHMLGQFRREYLELYPDAKLLTASSTDLTGKKRRRFVAKAATGDWDAVILTQGAFERIPMRVEAQEKYMRRELDQLESQITRAKGRQGQSLTLKRLEETLKRAEEKLKRKLAAKTDQGTVHFEDTGIDYLMVDEAHGYKNLATASHIEGASIAGSARASDLHMKIDYLRGRNESGRVVTLATGTPIANSVTEAFVMQRYLRPDVLEDAGIDDFDNWAATFGEIVQNLELAPDGSGFRMKARFARFHNAAELLRMYRLATDVQTAADLGLPTPPVRKNAEGKRGEIVTVPISAEQKAFVTALPNAKWIHDKGGILKAIGLASRAAIDMRLVGGEGDEGGKIDYAVQKIAEIYEENKDRVYPVSAKDHTPQKLPGSLQIVFMDSGTPGSKAKNAWDAYGHMKQELIQAGLPAEKIRFIHEAKTDKAKAKLFEDARNGKIAVLIGSTEKMGTGTNIQDRSVALHHMDFPWRPADMAQREGRIERQGNLNMPEIPGTADDIRIISYVTEETFDAFKLGTLERKATFIAQMDRKDFDAREMEDIGDTAVSFGQMKAIATGDITVMQFAEATADVVDLQRFDRNWHRDQDRRRVTIRVADAMIGDLSTVLPAWRDALSRRQDVSGDKFRITLGGEDFDQRTDVWQGLADAVREAARDMSLRDGDRVPLGSLGGHNFHVEIGHDQFGNRVAKVRFDWPDWEHPDEPDTRGVYTPSQLSDMSGRGILASLERRLTNLDDAITDAEETLDIVQDERARAVRGLGGSSPYGERLRSKERRLGLLSNLITANEKVKAYNGRQADPNDKEYRRAKDRVAALKSELGIEDQREEELDAQAAAAAQRAVDDAATLDPDDVERELDSIRPEGTARAPRQRSGERAVNERRDATSGSGTAATSTLTREAVDDELDSIRPDSGGSGSGGSARPPRPDSPQGDDETPDAPIGTASPRSLDDKTLSAEIVALIEHEMGHGPLTGAAKTRLAALEGERDRRAGKRPARETPAPTPRSGPGGNWADLTRGDFDSGASGQDDGLFTPPAAPQPSTAPDPNNPLDRPDDPFGTGDMFADAEGRDTSNLKEAELRRADKLQQGDRYTDTEGRTHTVAEPPLTTGRGRVRIRTEEGRELFYRPSDEFRTGGSEKPPSVPDPTNPATEPRTAPPKPDEPSGTRFNTVADVLNHWQSNGLRPTNPYALRQKPELLTPELSTTGAFMIGKVGKDAPGADGYWVVHSDSGNRQGLPFASLKEARAYTRELEAMTIDGKPYDWSTPGSYERLTREAAAQDVLARSRGHRSSAGATTFGTDAAWLRELRDVEAAYGAVSTAADSIWGRSNTPDEAESIRTAIFTALAAQEDKDPDAAEASLRGARSQAAELLNGLNEREEQAVGPKLRAFLGLLDTFLARHRATSSKRQKEDAEARRLDEQARADFEGRPSLATSDGTAGTVQGESSGDQFAVAAPKDTDSPGDGNTRDERSADERRREDHRDRRDRAADAPGGPVGSGPETGSPGSSRARRSTTDRDGGRSDASSYDPRSPRFRNLNALRNHLRAGEFDPYGLSPNTFGSTRATTAPWADVADSDLALSPNKRLLVVKNPLSNSNPWEVRAPGSMRRLIHEGHGHDGSGEGFSSKKVAMRAAIALEGIRDAAGAPFPWDAPDVAERARDFRDAAGHNLQEAMALALADHMPYPQYPDRYLRNAEEARRHLAFRRDSAAWNADRDAEGYTVPVTPGVDTLRAGDEVAFIAQSPDGKAVDGTIPEGLVRGRLSEDGYALDPTGSNAALGSHLFLRVSVADGGQWTGPDGTVLPFSKGALVYMPGGIRRKPRPGELNPTRPARDDREARAEAAAQAAALPGDLSALSDEELEALPHSDFTQDDWERFASEMDRRFPPALQDALPQKPPATDAERQAESQAMDGALGFGDTDMASAIVQPKPPSRQQALRDEYQLWSEGRFNAAEHAMRGGSMVNRAGRQRGYSDQDVFDGGFLSANDNWRRYASDELIDWFDSNGGRVTWNQYRGQARTSDRIERDRHEAEQNAQRAAPAPSEAGRDEFGSTPEAAKAEESHVPAPRFKSVAELREHLRSGELDEPGPEGNDDAHNRMGEILKAKSLEISPGGRLAIAQYRHSNWGGQHWRIFAPGSMEALFSPHGITHDQALGYTRALESIRDRNGKPFPWDAPDVLQRAQAFRGPDGENLGVAVAKALRHEFGTNPIKTGLYDVGQANRVLEEKEFLDEHYATWRAAQERDGYTIPVFSPLDIQAGDEFSAIHTQDSTPGVSERGTAVDTPDYISRSAVGSGLGFPLGVLGHYAGGVSSRHESGLFDNNGKRVDGLTYTDAARLVDDPVQARTMRRPRPGETPPKPADSQPGAARTARPKVKPDVPETPAPTTAPEPEPIGGRTAEWVSVGDLAPGDVVRIEGTTRNGKARTLTGYVIQAPQQRPVSRKGRSTNMFMTLISVTADGSSGDRTPVWTPLDASAARATGEPDTDRPDNALISGAESDVLTGQVPDRVAADPAGRGLFPGTLVHDGNGREGVVTGANSTTASVQWNDGKEETGLAPTSLNVVDGGAARPAGWTGEGQHVREGHVVSDRAGNFLGTVEEVDGDTVQVATREGITATPVTGLRTVGEVRDGNPTPEDAARLDSTTAGGLREGDVIVHDGSNGPSTATVIGRSADGDHVQLDVADTRTGEIQHIDTTADAPVNRLVDRDGQAPAAGSAPDNGDLQVTDPVQPVEPVTGPTVDPALSPEERDAIADHGTAPSDDTDVQQAAARIGRDLPVTPDQAAALADSLRAAATPDTAEGRAAQRAADHLDAAAGRTPDGDSARPAPGRVDDLGEGDTIALPDENDPDNVTAYKVVTIQDLLGGVRQVTVEDSAGNRHSRTLPGDQALWQLPELPAADGPDGAPRDPNTPPSTDDIVAGHPHTVARAVVDTAITGTATPGTIHQLRQQIAERLTTDNLLAPMQQARQEAVDALNAAGITGRERAQAFQRLKAARVRARAAAVRAVLRTVNDLEPLDGESEQDTANRAADLLRLIPAQIGAPTRTTGSGETGQTVARHVDDALMATARNAFGGGLSDEDALRLGRVLTTRMDATRQATARRILRQVPPAHRQRLLPEILALLIRIGRRIAAMLRALIKAAGRVWNAEAFRRFRERLVARVKTWPESRRLHRLAQSADLPNPAEGSDLGARIAHWARLLPAPGRLGQASRRARWYERSTRRALATGELPPVQDGVRWAPDRAADRGPGAAAMRHLAALRAAGTDMDSEINTRLAAARPELGDDPHTNLRQAAAYADTAERRARDLAAHPVGHSQNPHYTMELAAARAEAADARTEADRMREVYSAALPDVVADALASVREMGPAGTSALVLDPGSDSEAARALTTVQRFIPRDWLAPADRRFLTARTSDRGGYDAPSRTVSVADLGDNGLGSAIYALLMHLQEAQPDITAAQEIYRFARTHTGRIGARRRSDIDMLLARLFGPAGDGRPDVAVPQALQSLFAGDWFEDDDLRAFLLGLLATR
ncbi:helicase-related protein [Streptomyces sp. MBT27]|uniref:helicase-related protein n=1 Tax=Streptomyces sp. MBT27 TaxID=1488356 RepID=UPI0014239B81|nr:helicase-related protein [Streptomyces sp. MBT27]